MVQINAERFLADLHDLRKIGAYKTGVHRPTFSPQDMESRHWLIEKLRECGLEASIDGIGNVYGRHKGPGPHLLVGSHIESQNYAGWLDGALGVMAGVALARAGLPVDVAAFADEEGHFEGGFLGSRSIIGELTEEEIDRSRSRNDGSPLRDALAAAGFAGKPRMQLETGWDEGLCEMPI
ncbi:MAG: Zn-dependent hydrolase, partial [Alphaproteobacteria bacterium]